MGAGTRYTNVTKGPKFREGVTGGREEFAGAVRIRKPGGTASGEGEARSRAEQVVRSSGRDVVHYGLQEDDAEEERPEDYHEAPGSEHEHWSL